MKAFLKKSALCSASCLQAVAVVGAGAIGAAAISTPAYAQDYTRGVLAGTVVDEGGAPVAGAEVSVRSNEQGFTTTTTTDAAGNFTATGLPTGTYTVMITSGGSAVVEDRGVRVLAGQTNSFRYIAGAGAAAETGIVVLGQRVQVNDFAATETGVTLDVSEIASTVPIGRDQTSLILLAPGTVAGDSGFGNLASIGGATVAENAYYVNGLNITDFRNFLGGSIIPFELYRTIEVKTGGYQAEYGRALGGVTSAVTKSGSNEFKAGVVATYAPNWLGEDSPNTFTDEDSDPDTSGDIVLSQNEDDYSESWDASIYLSGPVIKDRLFFYLLYQPRWFKTGNTSYSNRLRVESESDSPFFAGKIDAVITDGHRLEFTYLRDKQTQVSDYLIYDREADAIDGTRGSVVNRFGGDSFIGTYTGQFTDWLTLSLAYGENHDKSIQFADPPTEYALTRIGETRDAYGTAIGQFNDINDRAFYRADADIYVNLLGEHHFRAGFDYEDLTAGEGTSYTGSGYWYDIRATATRRRYYFNEGEFNTNMRAFYLQDSWSLLDGRLNLQLGIRNDRFRNYTQSDELYYDSGDNWGPRLGATFDVFGDGATKLNAFWGRYFLPIATNTNIRLAGAETYYQQQMTYSSAGIPVADQADNDGDGIPDFFTFDSNGNITNFVATTNAGPCPAGSPDAGDPCRSIYADGTLGPTDTLVAASLKPSHTDEWLLGLSHRTGDWTFSVNYINRRLGETLEDVAVDAAVIAYCDANGVASCSSVWSGFHQYVLSNPGSDITVRLDGDCTIEGQCDVVTLAAADLGYPRAVRDYDAVELSIEKAFNGVYGFNASYVYTDLRGNFEGGVKSDNNQTDTGLTQDFDQPGFLDGADGDLANGRKHAFKFYGHVQPVEWLDLGLNVLIESPRKFSCIGNYYDSSNFAYSYGAASYYCQQPDVGGTPAGDSFLVPRGTAFDSEWNKRVDLRTTFKLGDIVGLPDSYFAIDVFNVFNTKSQLDFVEFGDISFGGPNPDYGKVRGYQAPRSVRLTLALRYGGM